MLALRGGGVGSTLLRSWVVLKAVKCGRSHIPSGRILWSLSTVLSEAYRATYDPLRASLCGPCRERSCLEKV